MATTLVKGIIWIQASSWFEERLALTGNSGQRQATCEAPFYDWIRSLEQRKNKGIN